MQVALHVICRGSCSPAGSWIQSLDSTLPKASKPQELTTPPCASAALQWLVTALLALPLLPLTFWQSPPLLPPPFLTLLLLLLLSLLRLLCACLRRCWQPHWMDCCSLPQQPSYRWGKPWGRVVWQGSAAVKTNKVVSACCQGFITCTWRQE